MPAAAAAPMQGTYIPQYTAVPASAITVEVRTKSASLLTLLWFASLTLQRHHGAGLAEILAYSLHILYSLSCTSQINQIQLLDVVSDIYHGPVHLGPLCQSL